MIILDNKYRINVDDRNYTLITVKKINKGKNAGQEKCSVVGYYGTLQGALKAFIDRKRVDSLKGLDISLSEAINKIIESDRIAKGIIENAIPGVEVIAWA